MTDVPALPLRIGHGKGLGTLLLVVGVADLAIGALAGRTILLLAGILLTLIGIGFLTRPALEITATEVRQKNPLGMTLRRTPIASPADLRIDGKRLVHVPTGRKIAPLGMYLDAGDVARLRALVAHPHAS